MRFLVLEWQAALDQARAALAAFVRAPDERLVFTANATTGVAIALGSAQIAAGEEILITDHTYRAVRNQLVRLADARGARIVTVPVPLPFDPDAAVTAITAAITPRTRLAVLDHVTSPTGLVMPLERIIPALSANGAQILIDGAHAPGQLALDIGALLALGVTWYAGNNHKWVCAVKGTGFLVTTTSAQPVVTSHGASPDYGPPNRLHAELDWSGTHDPTPHLTVPIALATVATILPWPEVIRRNHALACELRARVIELLGGNASHRLAPETSLGSMAAIPIALPPNTKPFDMTKRLLHDGWELPIVDWPGQPLVRLSAHLYNESSQAELVADKLRSLGIGLR